MENENLADYIFSGLMNQISINETDRTDLENIEVLANEENRDGSENRIRGKYNKISNERRYKIINAMQRGDDLKMIASYESLPITTIKSIIKKFEDTGLMIQSVKGGAKRILMTEEHKNFIENEVDKNCSITLKSLRNLLKDRFGVEFAISTIHNNLKRLDYSFKLLCPVPQKRNDPDTLASRKDYARNFLKIEEDYPDTNIFFLDEVGFSLSMRPRQGRSIIGEPASLVVKAIRSKNVSLCCCFNKKCMFYYDVNIKPYNTESFFGYINDFFQFLEQNSPGPSVVIMDNVSFHKNIKIASSFTLAGHKLVFLPVYSPFLNPIENFFSKWKALVKSCNPKNQEELENFMTSCLSQFTPNDFDGYYRNMKRYINISLDGEEIY